MPPRPPRDPRAKSQGARPARPSPRPARPAPSGEGQGAPRPQLPPKPPETFTTFDGESVEVGGTWKRLVAAELTKRRIRWRYRAFEFPLLDRSGREVVWAPDFFIYDEAPKLVRVIAVKGTDSDALIERSRLFKKQYPGIAVEVWGREKLIELGLLSPASRQQQVRRRPR